MFDSAIAPVIGKTSRNTKMEPQRPFKNEPGRPEFRSALFHVLVSSSKVNNFRRVQKLKNMGFTKQKQGFSCNLLFFNWDVFSADFRPQNYSKNHEIWVPNAIAFSTSFSNQTLMIWGSNLEVQKSSNFDKIMTFGQPW